jgi:putative DNA primase/helicase
MQHDSVRLDSEEIKRSAMGRWDDILRTLVPEIADAIGPPWRHINCPFHGGKKDFRAHREVHLRGKCVCTCTAGHYVDGFEIVMRAYHCTFPEALERVADHLGGQARTSTPVVHTTWRDNPERDQRNLDKMKELWNQAHPLTDGRSALVRRYLIGRGLGSTIESIQDVRCHPHLPYFNHDTHAYEAYTAMLAIIRSPDGSIVGLHRTWLRQEGTSIRVHDRRQTTALVGRPCSGGAIRLTDANEHIVLAEGIETALSAMVLAPGVAVWSCLNKELLRSVLLPDRVQIVSVFADADMNFAGQDAAIALQDRLKDEGRRCAIIMPPEDSTSTDWNDVVRNHPDPTSLPQVTSWLERLAMTQWALEHQAA